LERSTIFEKNGSALPNEVSLENFKKLDRVIDEFQPKGVIFLGDFIPFYSE